MKSKVNEKTNSVGWSETKLAQMILVALCLTGCFSNAALAQDREPRYVISKEGRRYQVEPVESYKSRLEARQSQSRANEQGVETSRALNRAAAPEAHSLAQFQTPIKDQMDRGTCWAFAGVAALEAAYRRKHNLPLDLSEQYVFHMPKAMEWLPATPENNTSLTGFQGSSDIVAHLTQYAVPEERFAPYLNGTQMEQLRVRLNVGDIVNKPTQIGYDTFEFSEQHIPTAARWNARYRVTSYGQISKPNDLSSLEQTLADNHEIVADFNLRWKFNTDRNVYEFDPDSPGGGHVMLLIGYDRNAQIFLAKNSWGESDFIRLTYDCVKNIILGGYYIKDVVDPNVIPQKKARFLGFWDFDDFHSHNVRITGRLVIRRFTLLNVPEPITMKLGSLYLSNGNGPLDVTGYYTYNGEGIVLDIHTNPSSPGEYLRFTYPLGFWRYVDRNYAGYPQVGSLEQPFTSFFNAVYAVPRKGAVFVQPGHYSAAGFYSKPMTIKAPQGGVTLGN